MNGQRCRWLDEAVALANVAKLPVTHVGAHLVMPQTPISPEVVEGMAIFLVLDLSAMSWC